MTDDLAPPRKSVELEDPGAKELGLSTLHNRFTHYHLTRRAESSESEEHFSDASEGRAGHPEPPSRSGGTSPIPVTRVERVDDEPSYGEVPGTEAYSKRVQDAVPDEVEIVPDGQRSRSTSRLSASDRPYTPGGSPIPKTVVEKVDDAPAYGEVPGTDAYEKRSQDAVPDVIVKVPEPPKRNSSGM